MVTTYYNENDAYAAQWLRNLVAAERISQGFVDPRSIVEVEARDLEGYVRAHFFAGIAGWDYALRLAGWPQDREVWTGSCPCQPFSSAGKRKGISDARHLWPEWLRLIAECRPATIFGEQVASPLGREWLAGVFADLEALGYACAGADLCAAGLGAPHIRQRLWWVAHSERDPGRAGRVAVESREGDGTQGAEPHAESGRCGGDSGLGDSDAHGREESQSKGAQGRRLGDGQSFPPSDRSFWSAYDLLPCLDGKARRIEPGIEPLAHGVPARVEKLRAYGNAIVPQVAAELIRAFLDLRPEADEGIL